MKRATLISRFFLFQELSDIQIVAGFKTYYAHKLVLSCSSDVFRVMLTQPQWADSQRDRIVLTEEPVCLKEFDIFMQYLYCGCIRLTHYNVLPVLMLADKYNVCDLREICVIFMETHIVCVLQHNHAVSWFQYANVCGHRQLAKTCYNFIKWNFHKVCSTEDFCSLEYDYLIKLLRDSDIVVPNEFIVYEAVLKWLKHHCDRSYNDEFMCTHNGEVIDNLSHENVLSLISCVRFPMMQQNMLQLLDGDPLASQFRDFFIEQVGAAVLYHSYRKEDRNNRNIQMQTSPRNYTNETWSSSLVINNYSTLKEHDVSTLIFSSPISGSQADENKSWEWNVDLYPKGVQFQKCIMIGLWRNLEISGVTYPTVRLVMESKTSEKRHVDVVILVNGAQDGVEYVKNVVHRSCCFDKNSRMCNLDDLVPFDELNSVHSSSLTGNNRDEFKITIVVKPL